MTEHNKRLDLTAKEIEALSADAFSQLLERIRNGEDPQPAIQAIMNDFEPAYREVLAAAFTATLARSVGTSELRDYPIGETTLSRRLYAEAASTAPVVREIVRQHMAGFHDARALSMQIYEGYAFKTRAGLPDDPLQWPAASPKWPKYMRQAINADPASFRTYHGIARRAAGNIKTPGYRAALNEALDALEKGRGDKVLARKLEVAFQERMRYHANRIAQTELHRAYMDKQAEEIMADDSIEVLKFVMSQTHPRTDICDLFSKQDKYGLGPGLYPKDKAPKPPLHPHCRCVLHSKRLLKAKDARENQASERQYLARVMREEGTAKAAQIIGGRAKLAAALTNAPIDAVVNIHRPAPYRLGRVTDNGGMDIQTIAKAAPNQPTWKNYGRDDLRLFPAGEAAPTILDAANSQNSAVITLRAALGIKASGSRVILSPIEPVTINDSSLPHVVEKRQDARERFANFIEPTIVRPSEVWKVNYDDGTTRNRYIKLFSGSRYDMLVMVRVERDGGVFWNMMQRDRKGMNALRIGELLYERP